MSHMLIRPLRVLAPVMLVALAGFVVSGSVVAAATPAPARIQSVTGGAIGTLDLANFELAYDGGYTANGQLGIGRMSVGMPRAGNGSATFIRSDGMTLSGIARFTTTCEFCVTVDLSGNSDIAQAHLALAIVQRGCCLGGAMLMSGTLTLRRRLDGYAMVDANGTSYTFGGVDHLGDAHTTAATDLELTPSRSGYWIVNADGQVFAFGDAASFGNANPFTLAPGERVTSLSATPTGEGYWLFTSKGRALPFGDAHFLGDMHAARLNGPIVGSIATPTGNGYYMVGSDGGIFAFGDARFRGSMGGRHVNQPVVGLVPTSDNTGYWLVASDGGVFSFNAPFHGSMGGTHLNQPIVTMVPYSGAYLMVAADGGVFNFSNGLFFGSEGATQLPAPIVNGAAAG